MFQQSEKCFSLWQDKRGPASETTTMLYVVNTLVWGQNMDTYEENYQTTRSLWDVPIETYRENIMDGEEEK